VVGELLRWTGAFPVRRGEHDEEALARARRLGGGPWPGHARDLQDDLQVCLRASHFVAICCNPDSPGLQASSVSRNLP
jgi:hypothetical protein